MADDADRAQEDMERAEAERDKARPPVPYEIPPGCAGECDLCGREFSRLLHGVCARCRDARHLP